MLFRKEIVCVECVRTCVPYLHKMCVIPINKRLSPHMVACKTTPSAPHPSSEFTQHACIHAYKYLSSIYAYYAWMEAYNMSVGKWDIILKYIQAHTHLPMRFVPPWTTPAQAPPSAIFMELRCQRWLRDYNVSYIASIIIPTPSYDCSLHANPQDFSLRKALIDYMRCLRTHTSGGCF